VVNEAEAEEAEDGESTEAEAPQKKRQKTDNVAEPQNTEVNEG
jgi:hypothetical protein